MPWWWTGRKTYCIHLLPCSTRLGRKGWWYVLYVKCFSKTQSFCHNLWKKINWSHFYCTSFNKDHRIHGTKWSKLWSNTTPQRLVVDSDYNYLSQCDLQFSHLHMFTFRKPWPLLYRWWVQYYSYILEYFSGLHDFENSPSPASRQ